jgi:AMP-polyphosphate phosphotransferase
MFEAAELGRKLSKQDYKAIVPDLRHELVQAQFALAKAGVPVYVIVSGVDGAGKGEVVHRLNEWLDPRGIDTHAFWQHSEEEEERPYYWRFWRAMPARGRIAVLFGSWYTHPIVERVYRRSKNADLDRAMRHIAAFEEMLTRDGAVFVKLWFHLSKDAQGRMLKSLARNRETHWRVLPSDWEHHKLYTRFARASERALRQTDRGHAPWTLIEAVDERYREVTAARTLLAAIQRKLADVDANSKGSKPKAAPPRRTRTATILDKVDLSKSLSRDKYKARLDKYQARLGRLAWKAHDQGLSTVIVFEGWDAAGKGSSIRRVTQAMDPRHFRLIPVAAPTDEERAHHYLWRFWRHLGRAGTFTIFDRSWYGRVLVERVEGFATRDEWGRAYHEINEFEEQLAEHGIVVCKFWVHISKDEQLRRFKLREETHYKRHKITGEDWRNREKWDAYKAAINDMVARTSTGQAPWTLVAGNDKKHARIQILKTLCQRLEKAL